MKNRIVKVKKSKEIINHS